MGVPKTTLYEKVLQLKICMRFTYLLTTLVLLLSACTSSSSNLPNQKIKYDNSEAESEILVSSLCELFDNPYSYQRKVIKLKTTLFLSYGHTGIGDERCIPRHPLIDVDFSSELKTAVCKKENAEQVQLCAALSKTRNDIEDDTNYVVVADFIGYFEYYETNEGFTRNGLRFRFRINKIENIEEIASGKNYL